LRQNKLEFRIVHDNGLGSRWRSKLYITGPARQKYPYPGYKIGPHLIGVSGRTVAQSGLIVQTIGHAYIIVQIVGIDSFPGIGSRLCKNNKSSIVKLL